MYQQIQLVGNLGSDVELRYTPSGVPVATFSLAINKTWTSNGEQQSKTTWFRISVWRQLAETCAKHIGKGRQVLVIGEVEEARVWQDREGNNRASLEVTASRVVFLGNRGDGGDLPSNIEDESEIPF